MLATRSAYSSGRPSRDGKGTCAPSDARISSDKDAIIGVRKIPGAIVLTRMPIRANSRANGNIIPTTPPLDAEYGAWPICPSNAATDAVLIMTPRSPSAFGSFFCMMAAASLATIKLPTRLICTTLENWLAGIGPSRPSDRPGIRTPAQLTASVIPAMNSAACRIEVWTFFSSATSVWKNRARDPSFFALAVPSSSLTSSNAT
jgi:hypothetical protein